MVRSGPSHKSDHSESVVSERHAVKASRSGFCGDLFLVRSAQDGLGCTKDVDTRCDNDFMAMAIDGR